MKTYKRLILGACLAAIGPMWASVSLAQTATRTFTMTYQGGTGSCNTKYSISGIEPADTAKHPVFIYTAGTDEAYDNAAAMAAVKGMAARGYVAAAVQYADTLYGNCSKLQGRTSCIYDPSSSTSAITAMCARSGADCNNKGIVAGGFSQGSNLATLAHDYDPRVAAVWGMGDGQQYSIYNNSSCMAAGKHTLANDRLRIADGVHDIYLSTQIGGTKVQTQAITGLADTDCVTGDGNISCYRSNGSGWHVVQDDEVASGIAGHCYMRLKNGCIGSQDALDPGWESGSEDWQLNTELDWLAGFTAH